MMGTRIATRPETRAAAWWLAGGVGLGCISSWLSFLELAIVWLVWIMGLLLLSRSFWAWLLGPLFFYDIVRTARRNRLIPIRCLYASLLLILFSLVYVSWFRLPRDDWRELFAQRPIDRARLTDFAHQFSLAFLIGQLGIVCFLTPLFTADAIAEERERRTLSLLLTTALSDREIVVGLLASRAANIGMIVMTGLPILSLLPFLGGVDPIWIVTAFASTGMTILSLGAFSMTFSVSSKTSLGAIVSTYCCSLLVSPCFLAPILGAITAAPFATILVATFLQACGFVFFLLIAVGQLRRSPGEATEIHSQRKIQERHQNQLKPNVYLRPLHPQPVPSPPRNRPAVTEPVILWKDFHLWNHGRPFLALYLVLVGLICFGSLLMFFDPSIEPLIVAKNMGLLGVASLLLPAPVIAAQMVSRECEKKTLDCLLVTSLEREEILGDKWLASVLGTRWALVVLTGMFLVMVISGVIHPLSFMLLLASWVLYAALLSCLGLFCSTYSLSTRMATLVTVLILLILGATAVYESSAPVRPMENLTDWILAILKEAASPLTTLQTLTFDSHQLHFQQKKILVAMLAIIVVGLSTLALWKLTLVRFRKITTRG
jgi:ABC-type transport system involved in multi-copper enzyme maturation permease subunit